MAFDTAMKLIKLSPENLKIVQEQTFSDVQPCSLLQDFNRFLNRVMAQPVPLSKGKRQPIQKWAALFNDELTEPDRTTLKRPLTIHYPSVLGLYLLVRAAGLGRIIMAGTRKFQLVINDTMMAQWQQLSATEQYFSLLDAWLTMGHASIIGEDLGSRDSRILGCAGVNFLRQGLFTEDPIQTLGLEVLPSQLGAYNVSLLRLFGLVKLQWQDSHQLKHLQFTPLGVVLFNRFHRSIDLEGLAIPRGCVDELYEVDGMQNVVQPWREDIRQLLHPQKADAFNSYIINASLFAYKCRRTLMVPAESTLDQLANAILSAFSFSNHKLFYFFCEDCYGHSYHIEHPLIQQPDVDHTNDICLKDLPLVPGDHLTFIYDLDTEWEFTLQIVDGVDEKPNSIMLTEAKGEAPREY
ncbi:plasmid pRiA4b ORF-3 family protein [Endozoicomonas acroporae]|uniref:plasmid pRiA4b ORF-3 family protein n=1 Tax=Endozoicomonas acroporae TaxID=1701104 RepID=UPI0013D5A71F|nr:plasmid pRiA4b ORF-3 family protein [Endozoicomonas acroporae]